ncbi:MAG: biopolymer transporter ExbD [Rhodospirillaceae bacterium]|nr:biopolymer transporter ExbD [Rhodospirillaceae bacterium]
MSMNVGPSEGDDEVMSAINTTPLVDVMLVLLIIFLITIPVVTKSVELKLPIVTNEALITKPENITLSIDSQGNAFWNGGYIKIENLLDRVREQALLVPQPEIHVRADKDVRYEFVGRVVATCQRAGILKVGFITDPVMRELPPGF